MIDAVALRKAMYHEAMEKDSDESKWESGCWIRYKMFERVLKTQPTIDPVPQLKWERDTAIEQLRQLGYGLGEKAKRGKWVKLDMHPHLADHKCTACGESAYVPTCMGEPMYLFCPNCGARMDVPDNDVGETEGEEG